MSRWGWPGWLQAETGPNVIPQLLVPMHCPISLSAHHIQGAGLSISSWVSYSQHWSTPGYTRSLFWSQHFKLLLEQKAEQMVPGLGATHLWRLLKAQPGQRPLAVLNNLSTSISVLSSSCSGSCCTSHMRGVQPPVLTLWNWKCLMLEIDYATFQWTGVEIFIGWAWLPYLSWLQNNLSFFTLK